MADPDKLKGYVAFVREMTIAAVLVLLLVFPRVINDRLEQAGFVKASIAGFEWESLQDSLKKTQEATTNAARLEERLEGLNTQLAEIRRADSTPPKLGSELFPSSGTSNELALRHRRSKATCKIAWFCNGR